MGCRSDAKSLCPIFEEDTLPKLQRKAPGAIGISITYRAQVLAAATLAVLIKKHLPGVPVILGAI